MGCCAPSSKNAKPKVYRPTVEEDVQRLLLQCGSIVTRATQERGVTTESLAGELGIAPERLERALTDPKRLTVYGMAAICEVLEIRINMLEQYLPQK